MVIGDFLNGDSPWKWWLPKIHGKSCPTLRAGLKKKIQDLGGISMATWGEKNSEDIMGSTILRDLKPARRLKRGALSPESGVGLWLSNPWSSNHEFFSRLLDHWNEVFSAKTCCYSCLLWLVCASSEWENRDVTLISAGFQVCRPFILSPSKTHETSLILSFSTNHGPFTRHTLW